MVSNSQIKKKKLTFFRTCSNTHWTSPHNRVRDVHNSTEKFDNFTQNYLPLCSKTYPRIVRPASKRTTQDLTETTLKRQIYTN